MASSVYGTSTTPGDLVEEAKTYFQLETEANSEDASKLVLLNNPGFGHVVGYQPGKRPGYYGNQGAVGMLRVMALRVEQHQQGVAVTAIEAQQ